MRNLLPIKELEETKTKDAQIPHPNPNNVSEKTKHPITSELTDKVTGYSKAKYVITQNLLLSRHLSAKSTNKNGNYTDTQQSYPFFT